MSKAQQWPRRQNESEPVEIALFLRVIVVARSGVVLRCIRAVVMAPHGDVGPTSVLTGTSRILQMNLMRREKRRALDLGAIRARKESTQNMKDTTAHDLS